MAAMWQGAGAKANIIYNKELMYF